MSVEKEVVFEPITGEFPPDPVDELKRKICEGLGIPIDIDAYGMTETQLLAEVIKLRNTLRSLRDRTGHALCWYNPEIWNILPEKIQPHPTLPCQPEFLDNCKQFWQEQNNANIPRT